MSEKPDIAALSSDSVKLQPLFPKSLESSLRETEDSPKNNVLPKNSTVKRKYDESIYVLPMKDGSSSDNSTVKRKYDESIYELPMKDYFSSDSSTFKRKYDESIYELPMKDYSSPDKSMVKKNHDESIYEPKSKDLVNHLKKLSALKSSLNVNNEVLDISELDTKDVESTLKEKVSSGGGFKRSRSASNIDSEEGEFTPKRVAREDTRYRSSVSPFHPRTSLPPPSEYSTSPFSSRNRFSVLSPEYSDRRKSLPAFSPYQRNRTDQTPYASPLQPLRRPYTPYFTYDASRLQNLESEDGFIDSHCHLDFLFDRQGYRGTWKQYQEENGFPRCYKGCLAIFCNPFSFGKTHKWRPFLEEEGVWAAFGCHPHSAKDYDNDVERDLCAALEHPKVRALGEIGLDYSNRNNCVKDKQFEAFRRQLKIALQKKLPVVVHCREAHDDGISIIKEILPSDYPIHLHCFTDTWENCEKWLTEFSNLCVGLTSVLSFASAKEVREVARGLPLYRLLLETDAPYFVPRASTVAKGTRHSHPGMAIHVASQVAAIKEIPIELVLKAARDNTRRLYKI